MTEAGPGCRDKSNQSFRKAELLGVRASFKELQEQFQAGCQDGKLDFPSKQESSYQQSNWQWSMSHQEQRKEANALRPRAGERNLVVWLCVYFQSALRRGKVLQRQNKGKMGHHQNKTERPEATGQVVR